MKKLLKYLKRFKEDNRAVTVHPVQFGSNYFYNASVKVDAIQCVFGFGTDYTQKERQIIKYCNRYNYTVAFSGFNNHCSWFYIMNNADYDYYINYKKYEEASRAECEKYMHECYMIDTMPKNDKLKKIMHKYELMYLTSLAENKAC